MDAPQMEIKEFHWMLDMLQSIDVGLVVVDREFRVQVWNSFMENHSGRRPDQVIGRPLFETFPDLPESWLRRKVETVMTLRSRAFSTWEQRPFLFRFRNYRPITGVARYMYQNVTLIPLLSVDGQVGQVGIIIYDVTDIAVNRKALEAANAKLAAMSRTDALTRLPNRGYWQECLEREFRRQRRTRQPCALVMFDIDHFKKVNDTYGHQAGDAVIRAVADAVRETARATDIPGRYGGEEFGVILIDTTARNGRVFAERLRKRIAATPVEHEGRTIVFTISLGIAEATETMDTPQQWLEVADQALYSAKRGGRNRTVIHQD